MATIHFIHGFIAYGKSTFAKKLARELNIARVNMDEIYFAKNGKHAIYLSSTERAQLMELSWQYVEDLVKLGKDVVFEATSWTRKNRDDNRARARAMGAKYKYYSMICTPEIALQRLQARNIKCPDRVISPDRFHERFKLFEPMQPDEDFIAIDNTIDLI